jgi:hypothetical protein
MPVVKKSSPVPTGGSLHVPAADSLQQLSRPPLSPGPLWFLLPHATFGDSCRGSQAHRLQQHGLTRRVGQLNANYGRQHKAQYGRSPCHASYGLCCHRARPPHRMTISLLAMPLYSCNAAANLDTTGRPHPQERPRGGQGHAENGTG